MKRFVTLSTIVASLATSSCGSATYQNFLQVLETDMANGSALSVLEALVVHYFPNLAGDAAGIDTVLQDGIDLLITLGALPPGSQAAQNAIALRDQIKAKIQALPAKPSANTPTTKASSQVECIMAELRARNSPRAKLFLVDLGTHFN